MAETQVVETGRVDIDRFIEKAKIAAAFVTEVSSIKEAIAYAVDLCDKKELTRLVISDDTPEDSVNEKKTIAAPCLEPEAFELLDQQCIDKGFQCVSSGLRDRLAGVDVGFTYADIGLAETGTLVLNCPDEQLRLSTMICEYHVCVLPKSRIVKDGFAAEPQLQKFMHNTPNYTAFITGPSRTADIERVLTIGVHGPLELHILVLED